MLTTDMTPHVHADPAADKYGYPPGVNHDTLVAVIISGKRRVSQAWSFGWTAAPVARVTHYRILTA